MTQNLPIKTIRMTPEFMREMDALNPKGDTRTLHMHVTTDGTNVPRSEIEAAVRRMIQNRIDGRCETSKSFDEPDRPRRTVSQFLSDLEKKS